MSVLEGLAAYKARKEAEEARREAASKPKMNRFNLIKDGDSAVIRFAQEIDPDATNYNSERGIGFVNIEHNHPDPVNGWKNRANCSTESQGACYACERVQDYGVEWKDRKGWKQKEKFYVNVIGGEPVEVDNPNAKGKNKKSWVTTDIDRKTGDGVVYLLEQGTYNGIWDALVVAALEDETITDSLWRITRKGSQFNDTSYTLTRLHKEPTEGMKDLAEFELINIKEDVLTEVPYAQQDAFYHRNVDGYAAAEVSGEAVAASAPAASGGSDEDAW